jgi:hypothetical protein
MEFARVSTTLLEPDRGAAMGTIVLDEKDVNFIPSNAEQTKGITETDWEETVVGAQPVWVPSSMRNRDLNQTPTPLRDRTFQVFGLRKANSSPMSF